MEEKVVTLCGVVLYATITQADFYRGEPIEVQMDNPRTGEVFPPILMEPDQFQDLQDLMSGPDPIEPLTEDDIIEVVSWH